jgi:hypothetical protein
VAHAAVVEGMRGQRLTVVRVGRDATALIMLSTPHADTLGWHYLALGHTPPTAVTVVWWPGGLITHRRA